MFDRIKTAVTNIVKSRLFVVIIVFCVLFAILVQRVFYLQIVKGQDYLDNYKLSIQKTREIQGTRGNIYDRKGNLLAYNELAYSITIEDNGSYDTRKEKNKILNATITKVMRILEKHGDSVVNNFGIVIDANDKYQFTAESDTQRLRFLADIYGLATIDKLDKKQRNSTPQDIIDYLCEDERFGYGIDQKKLGKAKVLKLVTVRYNIGLNSYQKYIPTTIAEDVSDETVADVMENMDHLQGVDIAEDSLRRYTDSQYFASVLGYTGKISEEEYDKAGGEKGKYALTDIVGKAGLEQTMDEMLQGKKGEEVVYVDSVGKVIETAETTESRAGNNLYLTIDKDLQEATYKIIEEKLAGIILTNMRNVMNYDRSTAKDASDVIIPIDDVYNSFFTNEILDIDHFTSKDAKKTEKEVYKSYKSGRSRAIKKLLSELKDADARPYKELSKEMQAYMTYIVSDVLTTDTGILMKDEIDTNDKMYTAWKNKESISLNEYLNYAISRNWVDASAVQKYMKGDENYSDASELYQGIIAFLKDYLKSDRGFEKLVYRYMIKDQKITGRQICLMLYEQNILKYDENQYNRLNSGSIKPYDFIRGKIETLEITPAQLALEPCTGSAVVTDPGTGEVLACVSYPGYDNNRLANAMDSAYYKKLVSDQSRPLFNNATQEKTAPGSTYKPLSAVAGLTEGVINTGSIITCRGTYEKINPSPKCWISPYSHGSLNVEGGIKHSCNSFFFEVGYRLSLKNFNSSLVNGSDIKGEKTASLYSSDRGLKALTKYAKEFGMDKKSGMEIQEASPEISDEDSVRSAIGQGSNNYTTSQMARYISSVANKGTVYDLSLLGKVTDLNGKTVKDFKPAVHNTIDEVSSSTWSVVKTGMEGVLKDKSSFKVLRDKGFKMAGKTGTAQQSKTHPDHALFVGFAPSDSPEIALSVRIANGYSSSYAAEIGRDIVRYHFKLAKEKDLITGTAGSVNTSDVSGD